VGNERMQTIIVVPNQKAFVPAGLMLREYFLSQGIKPILISGEIAAGVFKEFEVQTHPHAFLRTILQPKVHLVHIQLSSPGTRNSFFTCVNDLSGNCEQITISLWPDGLGNASWGERLDMQYNAEYSNAKIEFDGFFSFGFVHSTTKKLAGDFPIKTLGYELLQKAISNSELIQRIIAPASTLLTQASSIIIPFRPWCTHQFHGGVYDFGNATDLSVIYSDLIHIASRDGFAGSPIYFRPDERFQAESEAVMNSLATEFDIVDLSDLYPQWLTLEPLLSVVCTGKESKPFAMINLDSTSFQSVPFLADKHDLATGYIGACSSSLESVTGGIEFAQDKLTGKIKDFEQRYNHFQVLQRVKSVVRLDANLLRVIV
jgi:hypothetical protein